jgi:hypothetical protein
MQSYLTQHLVTEDQLGQVTLSLNRFKEYVSRFPEVIKLTVCPIGSFTSGLASKESSSLDLVVCMDGGALTNGLNGDQLALALSKGLNDWTELMNMVHVGGDSSTLIIETKHDKKLIRIHACKPSTFPIKYLIHSQLFTSYAFCDPRVPPFVAIVKQWAQSSGFSQTLPTLQCPLTGFHWTVIALYFLIESGVIPNLHMLVNMFPESTREVFGPLIDRDSYLVVPDASAGRRLTEALKIKPQNMKVIISRFFGWLSDTDLLSTAIDLKTAAASTQSPFTTKKGWILITDPVRPGVVNTVITNQGQKSQVEFAMRLQRTARLVADQTSGLDDSAIDQALLSHGSIGGPTVKVDKAVP